MVRTGGTIIRQKTDASQTNTDSFEIYNKSLILTKVLPYMDINLMSLVQCTSLDVRERIHDILETMYPHFEGYKRSVAAYHNFLSRTCLVCRKNRCQFNNKLKAFIHTKCIRGRCVNEYYLDRKDQKYQLRKAEFKHLPTFQFEGWSGRRSYCYYVVWEHFHPVLNPNITLQSIMDSPVRVVNLNAAKIAKCALKAAKECVKGAVSSLKDLKTKLESARREKRQTAREVRLKRRMASITRYLKRKKVNLMWKDCDDLYLDVAKMFPGCCGDFFHTNCLQVKLTAKKLKLRLPIIENYFQTCGSMLEYEVKRGEKRKWNEDLATQNLDLTIRNASYVSLCAARNATLQIGNVKSALETLKDNLLNI